MAGSRKVYCVRYLSNPLDRVECVYRVDIGCIVNCALDG